MFYSNVVIPLSLFWIYYFVIAGKLVCLCWFVCYAYVSCYLWICIRDVRLVVTE